MKLKTRTPEEVKKRFTRSLLTGLICAVLGAVAFFEISSHVAEEDEIPLVLRKVLEWNGRISAAIQGDTLSVSKPRPPKGKKPRVNGDLGLRMPVDFNSYRVMVESGSQNLSLPLSAFMALPKVAYTTDFRCIEGWSEVTNYAGGRFSEFMKAYQLGKKPDGSYYRYVGLETPDSEYFVSIDMDSMLHPQTVLAYEMNEASLSADNGAPIRLIIPIKYGIKSIKRIGRIFFSDTRPPDYWANEGYDWFSGL